MFVYLYEIKYFIAKYEITGIKNIQVSNNNLMIFNFLTENAAIKEGGTLY